MKTKLKTRTFESDFLRDELDLPHGTAAVLDEIESQGRWETYHRLVFEIVL